MDVLWFVGDPTGTPGDCGRDGDVKINERLYGEKKYK